MGRGRRNRSSSNGGALPSSLGSGESVAATSAKSNKVTQSGSGIEKEKSLLLQCLRDLHSMKALHEPLLTTTSSNQNVVEATETFHAGDQRQVALLSLFWMRLHQFQQQNLGVDQSATTGSSNHHSNNTKIHLNGDLKKEILSLANQESGYTPLHQAIVNRNISAVLLWMRHLTPLADEWDNDALIRNLSTSKGKNLTCSWIPPPLRQRPMDILFPVANNKGSRVRSGSVTDNSCSKNNDAPSWESLIQLQDKEGLAPGQLLRHIQIPGLRQCRQTAVYRSHQPTRAMLTASSSISQNAPARSFPVQAESPDHESADLLSQNLHLLHQGGTDLASSTTSDSSETDSVSSSSNHGGRSSTHHSSNRHSYACEVFTFGQAHHCALGVGQDSATTKDDLHRPRRVVLEGSTGTMRMGGGAVSIAGAAHHTLVATAQGHVLAFGLGKGGRLGMGHEQHCPKPTRVRLGHSCHVVQVTAAENHSLCLTRTGKVFAWGSNRFGQLGSNEMTADSSSCCSRPRPVDELRNSCCVGLAAGARHSIAITIKGEVYSFGSNDCGQLGIRHRRSGIHKVQRVEALWETTGSNSSSLSEQPRRRAIAVAASDKATIVLVQTSSSTIATRSSSANSIYTWGHGNHVPTRVKLESTLTQNHHVVVNPVAIDCALYHFVAATEDGLVYTWGLHSESLGGNDTDGSPSKRKNSFGGSRISRPQVVKGMLTENGGGRVIAVSASENHTAVVTESGSLFTWGATYGKNILGHEGVCYQPDPKQVPGVFRTVGVSSAKEHTVLLIGATFPPLPKLNENNIPSLEDLAGRSMAQSVDLFNVLPTLVTAERTQSARLLKYCHAFVAENLDGVLNFGRRSVLNCFMDEQLMDVLLMRDGDDKDDKIHTLLLDLILAGETLDKHPMNCSSVPTAKSWLSHVALLIDSHRTRILRGQARTLQGRSLSVNVAGPTEDLSIHNLPTPTQLVPKTRKASIGSQKIVNLTRCMKENFSLEAAEVRKGALTKELRFVTKRLMQVSTLERKVEPLSQQEIEKVARKSQLEADLALLHAALDGIKQALTKLNLKENAIKQDDVSKDGPMGAEGITKTESNIDQLVELFKCTFCQISCPDSNSFELHLAGRKHRNRVNQVEEDEKRQAAGTMMARKAMDAFKAQDHHIRVPQSATSPSAWGKSPAKTPPQKSPFRLPTPTVPISDSLAPNKPSKSLVDIMQEESAKSPAKRVFHQKGRTVSFSSMESPKRTPLAAPLAIRTSKGDSCSLSDFLRPKKSPPQVKTTSPKAQAWSSNPKTDQAAAPSSFPASTSFTKAKSPKDISKSTRSFHDIQREEAEWKAIEDQAAKQESSSQWYVQRRERAGSFREIQGQDEEDKQHQLLVEEQLEIERQIQEELRLAQQTAHQPGKSKRAQTPRTKNKRNHRRKKNPTTSDSTGKKNSPNTGTNLNKKRNNSKKNDGSTS